MSNSVQLKTLNKATIIELIGDEPVKIRKFQFEFLGQSATLLKDIVTSFNKNDFSNIKEQAHYLKTSARAVGAERCAYFLESIELQSLSKNKSAIKQLLIKLNHELKAIQMELKNDES
ncbi:Hpt domain-containing protein [Pseudoalteromonas phenolica]|uniref:HPt domain protein n=1 Tax=Pseudoalteromonas phenolica TaxID=161398 RepID=A0A0S2K7L4_9GAMM|nr:Hpt domain-containing protein [Pseudoalteromonas phenolica]ALO44036.1 HPt domain protein [Pseudoalteromonas phenolica]MBE0357013.1 hypothetical protein [Pseudoalteromonas phenolica O-BC30]RXE93042.1 Hpt domain-containing protein [Pseudoalteromonas phenolica O-BC30]TMO57997.1 Hpt domain-containing protein [Pseudoalteromonas phenolica]